jgi:hypothetical protein
MKRLVLLVALTACTQKPTPTETTLPPPEPSAPVSVPAKAAKLGKNSLLLAQAQFKWADENGERKAKPGAAKLVVLTWDKGKWDERVLEDEESRVFHKAACVDGGILTIGATQAKLKLWTPDLATASTLWTATFGGKWDRLRDFELLDAGHIAIATHDQGVIALLSRTQEGWTAKELSRKPDTFVHEIEVGDLDGDGKLEIYATPSDPNRVSTSQSGAIVAFDPPSYEMSTVTTFTGSHAKEILVADIDGQPGQELYAAVEAELTPGPNGVTVSQPVEIRQYTKRAGRWLTRTVAKLDKAMQARVLLAADLTHSGHGELIVTTMKDGIWRIIPGADQAPWQLSQLDSESTGFEHAAQTYDIDADGTPELYASADDQDEVRQYVWTGESFKRTSIAKMDKSDITWNITGCGRDY